MRLESSEVLKTRIFSRLDLVKLFAKRVPVSFQNFTINNLVRYVLKTNYWRKTKDSIQLLSTHTVLYFIEKIVLSVTNDTILYLHPLILVFQSSIVQSFYSSPRPPNLITWVSKLPPKWFLQFLFHIQTSSHWRMALYYKISHLYIIMILHQFISRKSRLYKNNLISINK